MCHAWERKVYKVLVGKLEQKRPLRRPRCRWETGMKMILGRLAGRIGWIHLAQDRDQWQALVNMVVNPQVLAPWI
jgi:hypothetical protein